MNYATAVSAMVKASHSVFESSVKIYMLVRIRKWQLTDLIIIQNSDAEVMQRGRIHSISRCPKIL